ncbi:MAG: septum formation family protein [Pseudonocardiales bacterium]
MAISQRRLLRGAMCPVIVVLALLAGCSRGIDEVSAAGATPPHPTAAPPGGPTRPGDCVSATRLEVLDCAQPHELEAYHFAQLPSDFPAAYPTAATLLPRFEPQCRARLAEYVGSPDVDASRLREYVYWPSPQGWNDGQRWVLCAVGEIGPQDQPLLRTGTLRGALRDGLGQFQACSKDPPSVATLRVVPCSEPHRGEAVPGGVLVLGAPSEPPVTAERANAAADPFCRRAADAFLGGSGTRPGVRYSWRYPLPESWPNGYTAVICYLETDAPVRGSLRDP